MEVTSVYHFDKGKLAAEELHIRDAMADPAKFAVLYNHYYEQIYMFIFKRVESDDQAADVCSQVFLKALSNIRKYQFRGFPFASWLYRIARNELSNLFQSEKARGVVSIDSTDLGDVMGEMNEDAAEGKISLLKETLKELSEDELEIIEMRFFEKRAYKEIGEILDITENLAKVKTYRILERLKKKLIAKNIHHE